MLSRRTAEVSWQWRVPLPQPAYSPPTQLTTSVCGEVSWTRSDTDSFTQSGLNIGLGYRLKCSILLLEHFLHSHVIQVIGTAALLLCVLALGDQRNSSIPHYLQPVLVGAAVLVIGVSMGSNSGYALNPARDLGPRIFTFVAGWGVDVFKWVVSVFKWCHLLCWPTWMNLIEKSDWM